MGRRDGKQDNSWMIERLEPQTGSSGIWCASLRRLLSYPIFSILSISVWLSIWWTGYCHSSNNIPGSTNSTSSGRWCLHILALLKWTSHIAMWRNGVVRRWKHSGVWLLQFSPRLFSTLWLGNEFPSQKPCCTSRTQCIFTLWHSTGTILRPRSSTCRIIWRSFIVIRMFSVDSAPVNLHRRSRKTSNSRLLWTNRRNGRVTPSGTIFLWLKSVIALTKMKSRSSQKLHNILSTNLISTLWRGISWTTSLTISASLATS